MINASNLTTAERHRLANDNPRAYAELVAKSHGPEAYDAAIRRAEAIEERQRAEARTRLDAESIDVARYTSMSTLERHRFANDHPKLFGAVHAAWIKAGRPAPEAKG